MSARLDRPERWDSSHTEDMPDTPTPPETRSSAPPTIQWPPRTDGDWDRVVASKHLLHALQVVGPYRPHAIGNRVAVEGGVGRMPGRVGSWWASGHCVDHHAVALAKEARGYRRPDVADATNQDGGR